MEFQGTGSWQSCQAVSIKNYANNPGTGSFDVRCDDTLASILIGTRCSGIFTDIARREDGVSDSMLAGKSDKPSPPEKASADELTLARERLAFYESFDSVIHDNIRRSGDLLRQVADERERNERQLVAMRQEVERRLAAQQQVLQTLAASLDALQRSLATITGQVGTALAHLGPELTPHDASDVGLEKRTTGFAALPADGQIVDQNTVRDDASPAPTRSEAGAVLPATDAAHPFESRTGLAPTDLPALAPGATSPAVIAETNDSERAGTAAEPIAEPLPDGAPRPLAESDRTVAPGGEDASLAYRRFDLVIRGVPRAAAALSIQRYLQDQPTIRAVEVREYVAGVLRFQLEAAAIELETLTGWAANGATKVLATGDRVVELRYPETRSDDDS